MRFEFAAASRIIFGPGTLKQVGPLAKELGHRGLVLTGGDASRADPLLNLLAEQHVGHDVFSVPDEPTTVLVREATAFALENGCELVIGMGGGTAIDAAKAVAALATNGGDPLDYIEVVGRGMQLTRPSLPIIAIPTTAGAGAEVTRNAVLTSVEHQVKASLRSPTMLPRLALVDPELTYSLPPDVTASTGLDALTQLIEPFTSVRANPLTDGFCREGMARVARSLLRAVQHGRDGAAREDMALASLLGGLALANAGLGAAHGVAGPVGGMFPAPHGAACAALLPHVMAANIAALRDRQRDSHVLKRYDEIAAILTGKPSAEAEDGVAWVRTLTTELRIPPLGAYGVSAADIPALVEKTAVASSTKANPIALTRDELTEILFRAL
jgi:alcohol dehydrogenase class IV